MSRIFELLCLIRDLPKTLYFNFKYLPIKDAVKLPILVAHAVYLMRCDGEIKIEDPIRFGIIRIGYGSTGIFDKSRSRSIWHMYGTVIFKGRANIGHGSKITVGGILTLDQNYTITA